MSTNLITTISIFAGVICGFLLLGIVIPISTSIGSFISDKVESFLHNL